MKERLFLHHTLSAVTDFSFVALQISLLITLLRSLSLSLYFALFLVSFSSFSLLPLFFIFFSLSFSSPCLLLFPRGRMKGRKRALLSLPTHLLAHVRGRERFFSFPSFYLPFSLLSLSPLSTQMFCIARRSTLLLPLFNSHSLLLQHLRLSCARAHKGEDEENFFKIEK